MIQQTEVIPSVTTLPDTAPPEPQVHNGHLDGGNGIRSFPGQEWLSGLAAGVVMFGGSGLVPATEALANPIGQAVPHYASPLKPARAVKCGNRNEILFGLSGNPVVTEGQLTNFRITEKACKPAGNRPVRVVETSKLGKRFLQKYSFTVNNVTPGQPEHQDLRLIFPAAEGLVGNAAKPTISFKATTLNGKKLGSNRWKLNTASSTPSSSPSSSNCTPNAGFEIGFSDDNDVVENRNMTSLQAIQLGESALHATALRIMIYPQKVATIGYQPYLDAINTATQNGIKHVVMSLSPNPSYDPGAPNSLRYSNLDASQMRDFARTTSSTIGNNPQVTYIIGNEPNIGLFSSFNTVDQMDVYKTEAAAGGQGLLDGNPQAKFEYGDLGMNGQEFKWAAAVGSMTSGGRIAVHPYQKHVGEAVKLAHASGKDSIDLSETGNPASDPNQLSDNIRGLRFAYCSGAVALHDFYNPFTGETNTSSGWDTGFVNSGNAGTIRAMVDAATSTR